MHATWFDRSGKDAQRLAGHCQHPTHPSGKHHELQPGRSHHRHPGEPGPQRIGSNCLPYALHENGRQYYLNLHVSF